MDRAAQLGLTAPHAIFENSREHLLAEACRVNALLAVRVHAHLASAPVNARKLVGAHLNDGDIRRLMQTAANPDGAFEAGGTGPEDLLAEINGVRASGKVLLARRDATRAARIPLLLDQFCYAAALKPAELDVVLLALLAEIDPNAGLLFAS